ncbi:MAG: bacteriohopanetetrol glucosamine biosynthesis glycosyltransferase HpnI [Verrucomicrobia bacterium]|nr:bacteriohopanetetrol glucosamine biosynthesis glycosyltransferase HpnI [Verrucomicrobiota bacterium]
MLWTTFLGSLALLSFLITIWQWLAARRFPLHQRLTDTSFVPAVTLLKPLKGCDSETTGCLGTWLTQDYPGKVQILFGVASADDPVCAIVRQLIKEHPACEAELIVCGESLGANAKVSTLIQLERAAAHNYLVISDADVRVPPDLLTNLMLPLRQAEVGLVNCFYCLANPSTLSMQWEAIAINADFWSQVLQSRTLKPLGFALGAVMAMKREALQKTGGFAALADYLADDYQLGNKIVRAGWRIELCPVVVECWEAPRTWREVWRHQLRWARTIRACQPLPYFFSILSNATLWPLLWWFALPRSTPFFVLCLLVRLLTALNNHGRLTRSTAHRGSLWLVPVKDLSQAALWLLAFTGNHLEWRGQRFRLQRDGKLVKD